MKQITITTAKATIIVFDLPEDALNFRGIESISGAEFKILGKASELTEEQWRTIVDSNHGGFECYDKNMMLKNFRNYCNSATESGSSLLLANGVMLENPCGEEPTGYVDLKKEDTIAWNAWKSNDDLVWSNPYVLVSFDSTASRKP